MARINGVLLMVAVPVIGVLILQLVIAVLGFSALVLIRFVRHLS